MNKKYILIATILVIIISGIIKLGFLYNSKNSGKFRINEIEKVEMSIYKNPYGYEITYPKDWYELNLPDVYENWKDLNIRHYFSPYPINEELHRLLLKPFGCEGEENGCANYFKKYSNKEYSLLEIYIQRFDNKITLPDFKIPDATKTDIIFSDGIKGVIWTQNSSKMRFIIVDDTKHNYRYQITVRNPQEYGFDFVNDILPIILTFHLNNQITRLEFPTQTVLPKEEINTKISEKDIINVIEVSGKPLRN